MLIDVEKKMREVTLNAPSYKELKQIYMARSIYMPTNLKEQDEDGVTKKTKAKYSMEEINFIQKNFCKGFNAYRGRPELKDLLEDIDQYMCELKNYNIQDNQVQNVKINFMRILGNFLITIPKVLINLLFVSHYFYKYLIFQSLAGLAMLTPLGILNKYLAEKARKEALAGSTVKVVGADVMASKKLATTIMLYPVLCLGFTAWFYYVISKLYAK